MGASIYLGVFAGRSLLPRPLPEAAVPAPLAASLTVLPPGPAPATVPAVHPTVRPVAALHQIAAGPAAAAPAVDAASPPATGVPAPAVPVPVPAAAAAAPAGSTHANIPETYASRETATEGDDANREAAADESSGRGRGRLEANHHRSREETEDHEIGQRTAAAAPRGRCRAGFDR